MKNNILSALNAIPPSELSYQEWINIGMALKYEGFDCSLWDGWSKNDKRYRPGVCTKHWQTFNGSATPVTGGTITQIAKNYGWTIYGSDAVLDWDDEIFDDGEYIPPPKINTLPPPSMTLCEELIKYISILFKPDEYVGYVTSDVWQDSDGKWVPTRGAYDRTAEQLIEGLNKHKNDIGAVVGDSKPEAGAWIRFNPVDGKGIKNENITRFSYALVESDTLSIDEQYTAFLKTELPIACLVHSGGKSLHAIVRIDAADYTEYRKRVDFLYDFLAKNGIVIDKQNRNPSRLSRMPGIMRNGKRQYLVAANIGRKSWADWMDFVEGISDDMPAPVSLSEFENNLPKLPEELIKGVLRCGHKMLISGSSKAGKSFLLMELCISIAEGIPWLGFECKKGRVLYVNLEIDPASCIMRFMRIYDALKIQPKYMDDIVVWNLRGHAIPLDKLVPKLVRRAKEQHFDAIIVDPIYKVITGDENNASEMAAFCNQFDKICTKTGCSTIYCHHHSKGAQGSKRAMDRASGSGVFARDPDAQLDMIQLDMTDDIKNNVRDGNSTAWRLECSLREFENFKPVNFWFEYPIHRIDNTGSLAAANSEGSFEAVRAKNRKCTTADERRESIYTAYTACAIDGNVTVSDMASYLGVSERCVRDRIKEMPNEFTHKNGKVEKLTKTEN